jgi:hypothetical protein
MELQSVRPNKLPGHPTTAANDLDFFWDFFSISTVIDLWLYHSYAEIALFSHIYLPPQNILLP